MSVLQIVDADSHIEEGPGIFEYLESKYSERRPQIVDVNYAQAHRLRNKAWLVDGRVIPHPFGRGPVNFSTPVTMDWAKRKPVSIESQMLNPASMRVADFDRLGVLKQVVYTTLFLEHITSDPGLESALWRAWNRWVADAVSDHKDKLGWVAMIPFWDPIAATEELRWCKDRGAVGVYAMGTMHERFLHDTSFDPVYGLSQEMDLPICVHIAWAHRGLNASCDSMLASNLFVFEQSLVHALFSFVAGGVLDRFSKLRVGIFEGYIGHYPTLIKRVDHWRVMDTAQPIPSKTPPKQYIEEGRIYFTCDGDEPELPEFIRFMGEDHVMLMADFPHVHYDGDTLGGGIKAFRERTDIAEGVKRKVAAENALRFYRL